MIHARTAKISSIVLGFVAISAIAILFFSRTVSGETTNVCFSDGCVTTDTLQFGPEQLANSGSAADFMSQMFDYYNTRGGGAVSTTDEQGRIVQVACTNGSVVSTYAGSGSGSSTGGAGNSGIASSPPPPPSCPSGTQSYYGGCYNFNCPEGTVSTYGGVCSACAQFNYCLNSDLIVDYCAHDTYSCPNGCNAGLCNPQGGKPPTSKPAPPAPTGEIKVVPSLVRRGDTTSVVWTTKNTTSCTVTEDNPNVDDSWSGGLGTQTSGHITSRTTYTLACTGLSGAHPPSFSKTATVSIVPIFQEN